MTRPELYKVGGSIAVIFLGWLLAKRLIGRGSVELGVPTVTGSGSEQLGDQGYFSPRPPTIVADDEVSDPVREAIERSNAAIDAYEVPPNPWGIE
jgi:hypothetical protein